MNTNRPVVSTGKSQRIVGSIITLATAVCIACFAVQLAGIKKDTPSAAYGIDFIAYYTAALLIQSEDAQEIYAEISDDFSGVGGGKFYEKAREAGFHLKPTRYVYLPIFLIPFTLFTKCTYPTAANLWLIVNLWAVIGVIVLEWSFSRGLPHPLLRLMAIISLNLCLFPLLYALKLGQTSIMICLIVCLIYHFTLKRKDRLAGILLGFIAALKYSPFLFILYFLYRKRFTLVISSILTVASLILLSVSVYGIPLHTLYWDYLRELSGIGIAAWSNQSLDALVLRYATKTNIFHFLPVHPTLFISIIGYLLLFSAMGTVYLVLRENEEGKVESLYPLEFSILVLSFLIVPAISWLHYFTLALLSIILTISFCWRNCARRLKWIGPLAAICYLMISLHPDYAYLTASFGQGFLTRTLVSLPLLGTCTLLVINLVLMKKARNPF